MFDIEARFAAPGEHQRGVDQHRAPVMHRYPTAPIQHRLGKRVTEADSISERADRVESDMRHDPGTTRLDLDSTRADTVHLSSAPSRGLLSA